MEGYTMAQLDGMKISELPVLDIDSRSENDTARELSNFELRDIEFCGVKGVGIEPFLQAFKTADERMQSIIVKKTPLQIHRTLKHSMDAKWQKSQRLYWQGVMYLRGSLKYADLYQRLFDTAFEQSEAYRDTLFQSLGFDLTHDIGNHNQAKTVLTTREFLGQTLRQREKVRVARASMHI